MKHFAHLFLGVLLTSALHSPTALARSDCRVGYIQRGSECVTFSSATDAEIRRHLIEQSVSTYSGSCPCPYNIDRAGRQCGRRSAYSRPGGQSPLCYPKDITDEAVRMLRRKVQ